MFETNDVAFALARRSFCAGKVLRGYRTIGFARTMLQGEFRLLLLARHLEFQPLFALPLVRQLASAFHVTFPRPVVTFIDALGVIGTSGFDLARLIQVRQPLATLQRDDAYRQQQEK